MLRVGGRTECLELISGFAVWEWVRACVARQEEAVVLKKTLGFASGTVLRGLC